jgi:citrate lyase subunit beta/citryl-CoA lyase
MPIRTFLYTPGNEPRKVSKVGTFGNDAVILDLEDAVAVDEKVSARTAVREAIPSVRANGCKVFVRINPFGQKTDFSVEYGADDIQAVVCPELDGIVAPKVESADELVQIDALLREREQSQGIPEGSIVIEPIIETALGLMNAYNIARSVPRVRSLHFGGGDFTRDMSIEWSRDEAELSYVRSRIAVVSRAAGIEPPTDTVWVRLDDDEGLADSAWRARRMGFQGKSCIHPRQIPIVNGAFSYVSPEELAQAKRILEAWEVAQARGSASIRVNGEFVDYPIIEKAQKVLKRHAEGQKDGAREDRVAAG